MSAATPTHVLQQLAFQGENGYIVKTRDYSAYMLDLQGWFMWMGIQYTITGKSLGGGLTRMIATVKA